MSTLPRSRTGCTFCKARRKKCDETKPQCLRCQSSGRSCNYEFVEYPGDEGFRGKRTKPAPRTTRELLAKASKNIVAGLDVVSPASSLIPHDSGESSTVTRSIPLEKSSANTYPSSRLVVPRGADASFFLSSFPPALSHSLPGINLISSSLASSDLIRLPARVRHLDDLATVASGSMPKGLERLDRDEGSDDDSNPDRARVILRRAPSLDKNLKENSLPFVLHCYSEWAIAGVFEPLKVVHTMRDQVTAQFSSENTRIRAILLANVMDMFAKNFAIDGARKSILNRLALDVRKSGAAFMATRPSIVPVLDKQNAIRTLDTMIEILGLQLDTCPMFDCIQTLESAAPVFRRACPGIPGRPVNLPNILLDLSLNLRHFATIDIIMSMLSGLPTCIEYEVPFSLELCDRIYYWQLQGNYGLQWLYGLPDQFIVLFAWINSLSETPGASDNSELIGWIERILPQVKVGIDESGDPALRTGKMVVLESWWHIVPIYLYMVLCKADANDPRVVRAQRGFMRLVKGVKLGRHPDAYLIISMTVAGVATTDERERDTLRQRIMGIPEYAEPGTTGNDIMLILEDIWARTRDEGRAATWSDMRVAYFRVSGR